MLMGTIEHLFIHWHMQGMPVRETTIMDMLDPFTEIVLDGIRASKEETGLTLHLQLEDARTLGKLLQAKGRLKKDRPEGARKAPQAKKHNK
jgi:hypothetical protein